MPIQTRRRKKRGDKEHEKRVEDALEAILPLGFTRELVLSTIEHLLQVYGGEKGWVFLEEDNYKILIDTILQGADLCSSQTGVLHQETSTDQIDIHVVDMKFNTYELKAVSNTELEDCTSEVDKNCADQACEQNEEVTLTKNQLSNSSISNESLPRKDETNFGNPNDCADENITLTHERDISISSASVTEAVPCSSYKAGTVNEDFDLSNHLEDVLASIRARIAGCKVLNAEKIAEKSMEPSLGCKMDQYNSWKRTETEGSKKEKDQEYKKSSKQHRDEIQQVLQENSSTENTSMICKPEYDLPSTNFQTAINSCPVKNFVQEPSQLVSKSGVDPISKSWDYAISSQNASLPVRHQLQDVHLNSSNLYTSSYENSTQPLKRKACFGWLSDDESSPERSDISRIHNDVFCNDNMTAGTRSCSERCSSGRNNQNEETTMLSNAKQIPDFNSSEYDCRQSETDIRRSVDRQPQTCGNHSKEIGQKHMGYDKHEHTKSGKSKQDIHKNVPHENETHDKSSHISRELQMDECLGRSVLPKASCKIQPSHEELDTYGSANLNSRKDGKPLLQANSKYSSYHRKTSLQPLGDYQRSESRRKDWNAGRTQHLKWASCGNVEELHEWHHRDEDERNSHKFKSNFNNNRYSADERYGRDKERNLEKVSMHPLQHERKDFRDVKNELHSDCEIREVRDKIYFSNKSYASSHFHFRSDHEVLKPYSKSNEGHPQPANHLKRRRWDVKPDLSK